MQKQQDEEGRLGVWAEEGLLMVVRQMPLRDTSPLLLPCFIFPSLFIIIIIYFQGSFMRGGYKFLSIQIITFL